MRDPDARKRWEGYAEFIKETKKATPQLEADAQKVTAKLDDPSLSADERANLEATQSVLQSQLDLNKALLEAPPTILGVLPQSGKRNNAYEQLTSRAAPWHKDPDVVSGLLDYAWQHMDNTNGIYNTVVTLKDLSRAVTQPRKADINRFCDEAEKQGGRTKEQCDALRKWLDTKP